MHIALHAVFLAAVLFISPTTAQAQSADHDAVNRAMQKVMRAFTAGDPNLMLEVVRKDAVVVGYGEARGMLVTVPGEEWAKGLTGKPAADEAQRRRSYQILDVTAESALVKLNLEYPMWIGQDYLSLSRINGEWMIISKAWSGQRRKPAP